MNLFLRKTVYLKKLATPMVASLVVWSAEAQVPPLPPGTTLPTDAASAAAASGTAAGNAGGAAAAAAAAAAANAGPAGSAVSSTNLPLYRYGSLELRPHLVYTGSYEDGLQARPGVRTNTYIDAYAPGMLVHFNSRWVLDYTPTFTQYSSSAFRDTTTHDLMVNGGLAIRDYSLAFSQRYTSASAPLVQTGRQTDTETLATDVSVGHPLSPRLTLQGSAQQRLTFVSSAPDFNEWSAQGALQIQLSPRVIVSGTIRGGFNAIYKSPDSVYGQPGGQIVWTPTPKISLTAMAALDERVFLARRWRWLESPTYLGTAEYRPFTYTRVQGTVQQAITPSVFSGQSVDATTASALAEQRFFGHFWLSGGVDFQYSHYLTTGITGGIKRNDYAWTYRSSVRTTFLKRGTIAVSYQDTDNDSNIRTLSVKTKRIACEVAYRY